VVKRAPRPLVPLSPNRITPVRLWPRTRPIPRRTAERAFRIAAFGPHVCRPFPVRIASPREEVMPGS
jgi:hypothetical protein